MAGQESTQVPDYFEQLRDINARIAQAQADLRMFEHSTEQAKAQAAQIFVEAGTLTGHHITTIEELDSYVLHIEAELAEKMSELNDRVASLAQSITEAMKEATP